MTCPECRAELKPRTVRGSVELDSCPRCKGVWVDDGEFAALSRNDSAGRYLAERIRETEARDGRTCPRCNRPMSLCRTEEVDGLREGCPKCAGLWFERNDLTRTLEQLETRFTPEARQEFRRTVPRLARAPLALGLISGLTALLVLVPVFAPSWRWTVAGALLVVTLVAFGIATYFWRLAEQLNSLPPYCMDCSREFDEWEIRASEVEVNEADTSVYVPVWVCPFCSAEAPHTRGRLFAFGIVMLPLAVLVTLWLAYG